MGRNFFAFEVNIAHITVSRCVTTTYCNTNYQAKTSYQNVDNHSKLTPTTYGHTETQQVLLVST